MTGHHHKQTLHVKKRGFTIVELLIVIVVIGILAAIVIVAYSGIQVRARNSQTTSAARGYYSAFLSYVASNGKLPPDQYNGMANYCLNHPVGQCVNSTAAPNWTTDPAILEPALRTIISTLPTPAISPANTATNDPNLGYIPSRSGGPTLDGTQSAFLIYLLEGSTSCPVGPVASGAWPNFTSTTPSSGYTWANGGVVECWVPLPNK